MVNRREPDQGRLCFVRAEAWLQTLAAPTSHGGETSCDLDELLQILFVVWLCERALHAEARSPDYVALTERVAERLCRTVAAGAFEPCAHDATLLLLCHGILTEQGRPACGIANFAHELTVTLDNGRVIPLPHAGEAVLLAQLGYRSYPARVTLSAADAGGDTATLLRADGVRVRAVCDAIAAATQFGLVPLAAEPAVRDSLAFVLPIILAASLRQNDLETGTAVLRALRYLRLTRTRLARQAITFVADQQQGDGRFGFLAAEIAATTTARGWLPFDAARRLYLPITVSCLWALAETTIPGFTLVSRSPMTAAEAGHVNRQPSGGPSPSLHRSM